MAAVITSPDVWTARRRRVAELRQRQGFARQLLDFYGALLGVQESAYRHAAEARPAARDVAAYVTELVLPSVLDVSVSIGPERMRSQLMHRLEKVDSREMVERWIAGDEQPIVDAFLARAALGPVLEALDTDSRRMCGGPRDSRHCPECGGPPQLSYLSPAPEDLAGSPRKLLCARCGTSWSFPRMTCAGCGEEEGARLVILGELGTTSGELGSVVRGLEGPSARAAERAVFPHMRVEACESCRRYLLNVDLSVVPQAVPVVDEMAAIPLDLVARDRGFSKIIPNLMGF